MNPRLREIKIQANYDRVLEALKKTNFHKGKAATLLGCDPKTVYNILKRHQLATGTGQTETA